MNRRFAEMEGGVEALKEAITRGEVVKVLLQ